MNLKQLFNDDDAVSPVIGVILMVAITVILAAVIASFVLGLGDQTSEAAPQVSVSCDFGSGTMTHNGGETVDAGQLEAQDSSGSSLTISASGDTSAGEELIGSGVDDGTQLIWNEPSGDSSQIIAEC